LEGIERNSGRILNIFRTLAHHPKLLKRWTVFGNHVLYGSTLPPRERELIILRTGYLCGSGYEWAQHAEIARRSGLSDAEIERIAVGPSAAEWSDDDRVLLVATDELSDAKFISDATWTQLSARWNSQQLLDIVFAVGQYTLVSMALNTFGVQLEHDTDAFPAALFIEGKFPLPRDRPQ
jgi:alkylhydroperoxidase family enzyme